MRAKDLSNVLRLILLAALLAAAFAVTPTALAQPDMPVAGFAISNCNSPSRGGSAGSSGSSGAGAAAAGAGSAAGAAAQGSGARVTPAPLPNPVLTVKAAKAGGGAGAAVGSARITGGAQVGVATLSWTDKLSNSVMEYQVWYGSAGGRITDSCRVPANTFQATIGNLRSGSAYQFTVVAIAGRGGKTRTSNQVAVKIP